MDRGPVPASRYTSPAFLRCEWERMWTRVWLLAGWERDVTEPGQFATFEIGPESILLVRGEDRRVRAFYNVCQHRGNRLCHKSLGQVSHFVCRFHRWQYELDGALRSIQDEESFPAVPRDRLGLREIACDTWGGFVWINMDPRAEPLRDYLGELPSLLAPYRFERQHLFQDVTVELDCNWKACVDGFNETYHVYGTHPQIVAYLEDRQGTIELLGRHSRMRIPLGGPSSRLADRENLNNELRKMLRRCGLDPAEFEGRASAVREAVQQAKRRLAPRLGIDDSALTDEQLTDDDQYTIFPNVTLNVHAEGLTLFRHRPHPADPGRMLWDFLSFQHLPAGSAAPLRAGHARQVHGEASLGQILDQDLYTLSFVQKGMQSRGFGGLWLGEQEARIRHFHDVLTSYVGEDAGATEEPWRTGSTV